eukprot:103922-Pleurochrysis_carterae.AAC.1
MLLDTGELTGGLQLSVLGMPLREFSVGCYPYRFVVELYRVDNELYRDQCYRDVFCFTGLLMSFTRALHSSTVSLQFTMNQGREEGSQSDHICTVDENQT